MAINFPDSPSVNDTYTVGDRTWVWDGTTWTVIVGGVPTSISEFNVTGDLNVGQDAEVDGILTANHIHGNIAGSVYLHVKNTSGSEIAAGTPVYATGSVGASGATEVSPSDASTAGTMPAVGITQSTLAINAEGHATILGVIGSQDTSTYSLNDSLYVAPGGGLTSTRPTSATDSVQKIARVIRVDGSSGELLVLGAGRTNDVPNEISISGDLTVDTDTLHVDSTTGRVGIGTTNPAEVLEISDPTRAFVIVDDTGGTVGADTFAKVEYRAGGTYAGHVGFNNTTTGIMGLINADGEVRLQTNSADQILLRTNNSTRVTITDTGNVGIGTTSPGANLHIASGATELQLQDSDGVLGGSMTARVRMTDGSGSVHGTVGFSATSSGTMIVDNNDGPLLLRTLSADDIVFYTNTVERMRVDESAGSVNVTDKFFVSGASTIVFDVTNDTYPKLGNYSSSSDNLEVGSLGGIDFVIDSNGNTSEVFNWRSGGSAGAGALLMQLNESGSLGVGRAANTYSLTAGSAEFHGTVMCDSNNGSTPFYVGRYTGTNESIGIYVLDRDGYIFMNQDETSGASYIHIDNNGAAGSTKRTYFNCNIHVPSVVKTGTSNFQIDHPLPEMNESHWLIHTGIEGPNADNLYRGTVTLVDGTASVNLDTEARMTEGTFVALNRYVQCFTTNETDWGAVKGSVDGNVLTITAQDTTSTATVSWMVIGERKDQSIYDSDRSDSDGRALVEIEQDDPSIAPRTFEQAQAESLESAPQ